MFIQTLTIDKIQLSPYNNIIYNNKLYLPQKSFSLHFWVPCVELNITRALANILEFHA